MTDETPRRQDGTIGDEDSGRDEGRSQAADSADPGQRNTKASEQRPRVSDEELDRTFGKRENEQYGEVY